MDAYIYKAVLYCEGCGENIINQLTRAPGDEEFREKHGYHVSESTDSEEFPQSVMDGGGESDTPQHCDECHCFLENPLTSEGVSYVYEALADYIAGGIADHEVLSTWAAFYEVTIDDLLGAVAMARALKADDSALRIDPRTGRTEAGA